jgi:hypothetical protein
MAKVRIEVFEGGAPSATITIPMWFVSGAVKLFPKLAGKQFGDTISADQLAALINDPKASGVVLEIEDHEDKDRIVISVIGNGEAQAQP